MQAGAIAILAVTAWIVVLDALMFRQSLPADYVSFYTSALVPRTLLAVLGSSIEEVKFRLIVMTLLVWVMSAWRKPVPAIAFAAAIVVSQFANVGALVVAEPIYGSLRFWAVGCVWGYLYWRHGWLTALTAHAATHLLLDPLLAVALL